MTSRERVLKTLNYQEPDRVPLDLGATIVTGIMAKALHEVRAYLGLKPGPVRVSDLFQMLGEVELDLIERLGIDLLPVEPLSIFFNIPRTDYKPWRLFDSTEVLVPGRFNIEVGPEGEWILHDGGDPEKPVVAKMPKNGFYFDNLSDITYDPSWKPPRLEEIRKEWKPISEEELKFLSARAAFLHRETDKALVLSAWGYTGQGGIGSKTNFLYLIALEPQYVKDYQAFLSERSLTNLNLLWEAVGDKVDVIALCGHDYGTQRGELFNPDFFREAFTPCYARQFQWIHENTNWKVFIHSCGSVRNIIEDLVEAGLDCLNPVQCSAEGMDPVWLKKTFGNRLTFWGGGINTQKTLPFGTQEEVEREVAEQIKIFAPGGGFIFCPVHNIQYNTPAGNIVTAYDTAKNAGCYPIDK